jgi:hypothetical protein
VHYCAADTHVRTLLAEALFHADHADRNLPDHTGAEAPHTHIPYRGTRRSPRQAGRLESLGRGEAVQGRLCGGSQVAVAPAGPW